MKPGSDARVAAVEMRIGHRFRTPDLIQTALTHASAASQGRDNYQRLEFLGDRVLGLLVTEMLLEAYPKASEGELSLRLAELVRKETCADVAAGLELGDAVAFGGNRTQKASLQTVNVLGDVCEAVIGAIYLDGGIERARGFVSANWRDRMLAPAARNRNAKAALQEWAQGRSLGVPGYAIVAKSGPDHDPRFEVEVSVETLTAVRGEGRTRRDAEQAAAAALLVREGIWASDA
jgi:ribonuclease-3